MALNIDVVSDFVCPWCWIGKRHVDALAQEIDVVRHWHPYFLHPDMPEGGVDRAEFVREKFGSAERARELGANVTAAAKAVGLDIDYTRVTRVPDTRNAHRLVRWASGQGCADAVAEGLFSAYFNEGRDIGDTEVLAAIGADTGMDRTLLLDLLSDDADSDIVGEEAARARAMGVNGVPTLVFQKRITVVGAQPLETLRRAAALVAANA